MRDAITRLLEEIRQAEQTAGSSDLHANRMELERALRSGRLIAIAAAVDHYCTSSAA